MYRTMEQGSWFENAYRACEICPRRCGADRTSGPGYCGMGDRMKAARAMLHRGEEPCIAGTGGAGAIFFSGCSLRCAYCQNFEISHEGKGFLVTVDRLCDIMKELTDAGASCIDLVTATHFTPSVARALERWRPPVPVVWNSGGYERAETLKRLEGLVQVYLPDLKHHSPRLSKLCADAADYFEAASSALKEMRRQVGSNVYSPDGLLLKGLLVRHLVLPGCTSDSIRLLRFMAEELPGVPVSLMRQYTPLARCRIPGLDRRVTDAEYARVTEAAQALGITGYVQEKESADSVYTPEFNGEGLLEDRGC